MDGDEMRLEEFLSKHPNQTQIVEKYNVTMRMDQAELFYSRICPGPHAKVLLSTSFVRGLSVHIKTYAHSK